MLALNSTIESVTVYRQGARITRIADLARDGSSFPTRVKLAGLPLALIDATVRARVLPVEGAALGLPVAADLRVSVDISRGDPEALPADDEELERARLEAAEQAALVAQIERERERLAQLDLRARAAAHTEIEPPPTPLEARLELLELRHRVWARLTDELEAEREELRERRRRLAMLEERDRRAGTARRPRESELRKCAVVSLRGGSSAAARIALEYAVAGAQWAPAYIARLDAAGTALDLAVRAVVAQRTGEDWRGVALRLVTADLESYTEVPELRSIRIGRRQPEPRTGWRPPPVGAEELYADFDSAFAAEQPPEAEARVEEVGESEDTRVYSAAPGPPQATPAPAAASPGAPRRVAMATPDRSDFEDEVTAEHEYTLAGSVMPQVQAAAPLMKSARLGLSRSRRSRGQPVARLQQELELGDDGFATAEVPVVADDALLDYGSLRMAGPEAVARGKLVRQSAATAFAEDLRQAKWSVGFDVGGAVAAASAAAASAGFVPVPGGHSTDFPSDYDYSYFSDSPLDVPSDGEFHSVALTQAADRCKLFHIAVPRESTDVFRVAELTNPLEGPLVAGPIDVYLDGDFLLASRVSFTPPGGMLQFGLGVDQAVKLVRNTSFREDSAGLMGGSRVLHQQIRLEAINHRSRPIALEIRERVPVLREDEDDIKVELGAVSPAWEAFRSGEEELGNPRLRGGFRWRLDLGAGEKTELKASYSIKISSKHELVGGNRRER